MYTDQKTKFDYIKYVRVFNLFYFNSTVTDYSTVTDFAKFLGLSISQFFNDAT